MHKSLYIHIPFCKKKCLYCDFYSVSLDKEIIADYLDVLCRQLDQENGKFTTIYIGGGTPSALSVDFWNKLLRRLKKVYTPDSEYTIEANPESLNKTSLKLFRKFGVNRISIGLQSLDDGKLKKLGRIHSASIGIRAVQLAVECGFKNISVDLIFGVWGQGSDSWVEELEKVSCLPINHISAYCLSYEENTHIFKGRSRGEIIPLSEDEVVGMYEYNMEYLPNKGFEQYEVSNFSNKGFECQHNLNYWNNLPYLGLGPSAVSYLKGVRQKNCSDVVKYIELQKNLKSVVVTSEKLNLEEKARETAALKIRTKEGIDFSWFKKSTNFEFLALEGNALDELIDNGFIKLKMQRNEPTGIFLTKRGFMFCDAVSHAFL